ncbi:hypothetical protein BDZ45DRAFT_746472 [Acephala macrosclerotiorum]|nr:hypothetical protein BDZ45DRAFT_746472 [Acephala macrosclerotiorum]
MSGMKTIPGRQTTPLLSHAVISIPQLPQFTLHNWELSFVGTSSLSSAFLSPNGRYLSARERVTKFFNSHSDGRRTILREQRMQGTYFLQITQFQPTIRGLQPHVPADPRTMPKAECPSRGITPATILFDSKYTTIATPRRGVPPYTLDEDEDVKMIGFRINIFNASMNTSSCAHALTSIIALYIVALNDPYTSLQFILLLPWDTGTTSCAIITPRFWASLTWSSASLPPMFEAALQPLLPRILLLASSILSFFGNSPHIEDIVVPRPSTPSALRNVQIYTLVARKSILSLASTHLIIFAYQFYQEPTMAVFQLP